MIVMILKLLLLAHQACLLSGDVQKSLLDMNAICKRIAHNRSSPKAIENMISEDQDLFFNGIAAILSSHTAQSKELDSFCFGVMLTYDFRSGLLTDIVSRQVHGQDNLYRQHAILILMKNSPKKYTDLCLALFWSDLDEDVAFIAIDQLYQYDHNRAISAILSWKRLKQPKRSKEFINYLERKFEKVLLDK